MTGGIANRTRRRAADQEQARAAWLLASDLAANEFGADVRLVMQTRGTPGRGSDDTTARARKVACWLAMTVCNVAPEPLSQAARIDRKTLRVHGEWVEDQCDDPLFEARMTLLSDALMMMAMRVVMAHLHTRGLDHAA